MLQSTVQTTMTSFIIINVREQQQILPIKKLQMFDVIALTMTKTIN